MDPRAESAASAPEPPKAWDDDGIDVYIPLSEDEDMLYHFFTQPNGSISVTRKRDCSERDVGLSWNLMARRDRRTALKLSGFGPGLTSPTNPVLMVAKAASSAQPVSLLTASMVPFAVTHTPGPPLSAPQIPAQGVTNSLTGIMATPSVASSAETRLPNSTKLAVPPPPDCDGKSPQRLPQPLRPPSRHPCA